MIHPLLLFAVVLLSCAATTVDAFCSSSVTFKKTTTHHDDNDIVNVGRRLLQHNVECHGNKIFCMYATADSSRDDDESAKRRSSNNNKNKSLLFEMPKMPWDVNDEEDEDAPSKQQSQQQWQWWPNNNNNSETSSRTLATQPSKSSSSNDAQQKQTRQTRGNKQQQQRRRVPRYPSALQYDSNVSMNSSLKVDKENAGDDDDVDVYIQSAQDALSQSTVVDQEQPSTQDESTNNTNQPRNESSSSSNRSRRTQQQQKLGILLIDHGSKRKASNEHLHTIAKLYQGALNDRILSANTSASAAPDDVAKASSPDDVPSETNSKQEQSKEAVAVVVVKAAHMEIATPSIHAQLTSLIADDGCTRIICVPYFLSPGKHATIDVPNLIEESSMRLEKDGLLDYYHDFVGDEDGTSEVGKNKKGKKVEIHLSKALGIRTAY